MSYLKTVIVQCGNEEYALDIASVVSIERLEKVTPIPHLPSFVVGLMNIRGELVPILDFEQILYNKSALTHDETRVVVVQTDRLHIGLLVPDAKEILDIPTSSLTKTGLLAYSKTPYFTAVANLENRMITMIDPEILSETITAMDEIEEYVETQAAAAL
ncbi:chemotaxis protein CheW [Sporosarcina sp. HYO08]|uniref:chemotaxis protein CheW n=1 Tax=Sporosarcina sp. HYO08 TaxID=1759557 RepID=UPI0007922FF7|nr:chemotaxis protein CheW [Sporosarcina sp. HYO08]KXH87513.1 chemotaxis protein CheW [Sporosarcina sp. HYO08]